MDQVLIKFFSKLFLASFMQYCPLIEQTLWGSFKMLSNKFTQSIFLLCVTFGISSCGKNIMKTNLFSTESISNESASAIQGYWKSKTVEIDTTGEIDQNIYNISEYQLSKSNRSVFDDQLKTHECSKLKNYTSFDKIEAEIHIFFFYDQYYLVANVFYTIDEGTKIRCSGDLGHGNFISDADNYYFLQDLNLGIKIQKQSADRLSFKFLR